MSEENTNKKNVCILTVGYETPPSEDLNTLLNSCELIQQPYDMEKLMEPVVPPPHLILCGLPSAEISLVEVAQMLRMNYQHSVIYLVTNVRVGFDRKNYQKNGFTDAFLLPIDMQHYTQTISEFIAKLSNNAAKSYRPVKIIDIQPGESLDFDTTIYLPANKRYIRYSEAGEPLDEAHVQKLSQHKMSTVYVTLDQMDQFYKYTADRLRKLGSSSTLSETEKREKLSSSVRELMTDIFNDSNKDSTFEQGQSILSDCKNIVNTFIFDNPKSEWYKKLLNTIGERGSNYSHSANVSTYAALFSIALGIGDPAELAMAGLLHDIGLADIPDEIASKPEHERTREGQALWEKHPELSVNILKARKLVLPEKVMKAILQHHENYNGTGFPNKHVGSKICKEAQILALADKFDELTCVKDGRAQMTPTEAIQFFRNQVVDDPGKMIFDPELLKSALKIFPTEQSEKETHEHGKKAG